MSLVITLSDKSCGTCTKCCEGSLKLIVRGQKVFPGHPCPLLDLNSGCSDYENRPAMPCKTYRCQWLKNAEMPERFKPNLINFIVHRMWLKKHEYYTLIPSGIDLKISDIEDIFLWFKEEGYNFSYVYQDKEYLCGTEEFLKECYNNKDLKNKTSTD
jgi:hypothetical protein